MSVASYVQREGTVKFGTSAGSLVNVHDDVIKCRLVRTFESVERRGTFGNSRNTIVPGNFNDEIQIDYYALGTSAQTTLDGLISEAVFGATPSTVLFFEFSQSQDATGAGNQKFTGSVSVLEAAKGGEVGTMRSESLVMPVLTLTRASV